jgi:hypothetical protein
MLHRQCAHAVGTNREGCVGTLCCCQERQPESCLGDAGWWADVQGCCRCAAGLAKIEDLFKRDDADLEAGASACAAEVQHHIESLAKAIKPYAGVWLRMSAASTRLMSAELDACLQNCIICGCSLLCTVLVIDSVRVDAS